MNTLTPVLSELPPDKATQLEKAYADLKTQADQWMTKAKSIVVTDASQLKEMKLARESRLALVKVRGLVEKMRLSLVAEAKQYTQAVDAYARGIREESERVEAVLFESENFAVRQEQARKDERRNTRSKTLTEMGINSDLYHLGEMEEADWVTLHAGLVAAKEQERIAKETAARVAEDERIERARVAVENDRLKKEAAAAEAEAKRLEDVRRAELERLAAEQRQRDKAAADALAAEQARARDKARAAQAEAQRLLDQQKAEAEAKLAAERRLAMQRAAESAATLETLRKEAAERQAAQQRVIDQQKAEAEAARKQAMETAAAMRRQELQAEAAKEAEAARLSEAPDVEKLQRYLDAINAVVMPEVSSPKHKAAVNHIAASLMRLETEVLRMIK